MFTLRPRGRAAFATVLALSSLGATASAASAAVRHIAPAGTDAGDCVATPCETLRYAVDRVNAGDTVQLAAGVYPVGDAAFGANDVTYERSGPGEAKITVPGDSYGIQVGGQNVTFRNLTISSPDDTIQGDTWGFTYSSSGLTLENMHVGHLSQGVVGGHGITVTNSTFTDINGTSISLDDGLATATDNDFTAGTGIYVSEQATVAASGNVFRGRADGGGSGIYVAGGSAGGTATGNRFSPLLAQGINSGQQMDVPNNWWGCNEGIEHDGCVDNYDLPVENAEPHLMLELSASPNPFPTAAFSTITASLVSSDPESAFVGGPIGSGLTLATSAGSLDDTNPSFVAGVAQTALRRTTDGFATVTATLDNATASSTVESVARVAQAITFTSTAPTAATVGDTYDLTATGGASGNAVTFSVDGDAGTDGACTISGQTASFTGIGQCVINADQLGDANHTAAAQVQQTVAVAAAPVTSAALDPSSFSYDAVNAGAGDLPQRKTLTLTNTGNRAITVETPTLTGSDAADYVIDAVACETTLQPDDQCTYSVTFAPVTVDATYDASASLDVQYARSGETVPAPLTASSALSGRVNEAPFAFEAESNQVNVGSATVTTTTTPTKISFTNTGRRGVHADVVSLIGQDRGSYTVTADTCTNAQIAPGGTCFVTVDFTPTSLGATMATLQIAYNGGAGAVNVALTGTGQAKPADPVVPVVPVVVPVVPPTDTVTPTVPPLSLGAVRAPVRCLTYGAATPRRDIALNTNATATVRWTLKKVAGSKALSACPPARSESKQATRLGKTRKSGVLRTNAAGSAKVRLATVLPAKLRKALEPGLYRIAFVGENATGSSSKRVILIRVLKPRR